MSFKRAVHKKPDLYHVIPVKNVLRQLALVVFGWFFVFDFKFVNFKLCQKQLLHQPYTVLN